MSGQPSNISKKITNAVNQFQQREVGNERSDSTWVSPGGEKYNTKDRIVASVPPVEPKRPTHAQLFSKEGLPNWRFMVEHFKKEGHLTEEQLLTIVNQAAALMQYEPNLVKVGTPAVVIGDIHGQLFDLFSMFECSGYPDEEAKLDTKYIFLGDYVDRGDRSIEVLVLLYALKINYPDRITLLRGNHECKRMTEYFTFKLECTKRYSLDLFNSSVESFMTLPLAAILNEQFLCVHAGISSKLMTLDDIDKIDRFVLNTPSKGLFCDLLWSDPFDHYDDPSHDTEDELFAFNMDRRCSEFYSYRSVVEFLDRNDLLCVIRGHQPQDKGYRMYRANPETGFPTLITLFSAPNYCHTYQNKAASLLYDGELFNIKQYNSNPITPYYLPDFMNALEWSLPFAVEKVFDILSAILNISTNEELSMSLPMDEITSALSKTQLSDEEAEAELESIASESTVHSEDGKDLEHNLNVDQILTAKLRSKILAMGRMSRMLGVLRSEVEKVDQIKEFTDGRLPKGTLVNGREELHNVLHNFKEARQFDLKNEGLPPPKEGEKQEGKEDEVN